MTHVKVIVQSKEEAENGKKIVDVHPEDIIEAENLTIGILEGGMQSGKTSLMFCHEHKDGTVSVAQCSGVNLEQLYAVFKGAKHRFNDK